MILKVWLNYCKYLRMETNTYYIGCSGFSNADWKGLIYPEKGSSRDYLKLYAGYFNAVEINSTFYRTPTAKTLEHWYSETPEGFKFFIKIPKNITHLRLMKGCKAEIAEFCRFISVSLREKLAGFLFQMPPSFKNDEENAALIMSEPDPSFLNVAEFRHISWWTQEACSRLAERNIIFSGVSFPSGLPEKVVINNPKYLYYRLHGKPVLYKSEYPENVLEDLARELKESGRICFVFFNNTWGSSAVHNGLFLSRLLAE